MNPITTEVDVILNWDSNPIKITPKENAFSFAKENEDIVATISLGLFNSFGQNLDSVISKDLLNNLKLGQDKKLYINIKTTLDQSDW